MARLCPTTTPDANEIGSFPTSPESGVGDRVPMLLNSMDSSDDEERNTGAKPDDKNRNTRYGIGDEDMNFGSPSEAVRKLVRCEFEKILQGTIARRKNRAGHNDTESFHRLSITGCDVPYISFAGYEDQAIDTLERKIDEDHCNTDGVVGALATESSCIPKDKEIKTPKKDTEDPYDACESNIGSPCVGFSDRKITPQHPDALTMDFLTRAATEDDYFQALLPRIRPTSPELSNKEVNLAESSVSVQDPMTMGQILLDGNRIEENMHAGSLSMMQDEEDVEELKPCVPQCPIIASRPLDDSSKNFEPTCKDGDGGTDQAERKHSNARDFHGIWKNIKSGPDDKGREHWSPTVKTIPGSRYMDVFEREARRKKVAAVEKRLSEEYQEEMRFPDLSSQSDDTKRLVRNRLGKNPVMSRKYFRPVTAGSTRPDFTPRPFHDTSELPLFQGSLAAELRSARELSNGAGEGMDSSSPFQWKTARHATRHKMLNSRSDSDGAAVPVKNKQESASGSSVATAFSSAPKVSSWSDMFGERKGKTFLGKRTTSGSKPKENQTVAGNSNASLPSRSEKFSSIDAGTGMKRTADPDSPSFLLEAGARSPEGMHGRFSENGVRTRGTSTLWGREGALPSLYHKYLSADDDAAMQTPDLVSNPPSASSDEDMAPRLVNLLLENDRRNTSLAGNIGEASKNDTQSTASSGIIRDCDTNIWITDDDEDHYESANEVPYGVFAVSPARSHAPSVASTRTLEHEKIIPEGPSTPKSAGSSLPNWANVRPQIQKSDAGEIKDYERGVAYGEQTQRERMKLMVGVVLLILLAAGMTWLRVSGVFLTLVIVGTLMHALV